MSFEQFLFKPTRKMQRSPPPQKKHKSKKMIADDSEEAETETVTREDTEPPMWFQEYIHHRRKVEDENLPPKWFQEYLKAKEQKEQEEKEEEETSHADLRIEALNKRRIQKGVFTRCANKLQKLIDQFETNEIPLEMIQEEFNKLTTVFKKLEAIQEQVLEYGDTVDVVDDEEYDALADNENIFQDMDLKVRLLRKLDADIDLSPFKAGKEESDGSTDEGDKDEKKFYAWLGINFDVGKEVRRFTGDRLTYRNFRVSWDYADERLKKMAKTPAERLICLKKVLGKEPLMLIESLPDIDQNYIPALKMLDEIYLDNSVFAQSVLDKLLDTPRMEDKSSSLKDGYLTMIQAKQTLNGLLLSKEQVGDLIFTSVCERKLSPQVRQSWEKLKSKNKDSKHPMGHTCCLDDLLSCLKEAMKIRDRMDCEDNFGQRAKEETKKTNPKGGGAKQTNPTAPSSFATKAEKTSEKKCSMCEKPTHWTSQCRNFKSLSVEDRLKKIKNEKRCFLCFDKHISKNCPQQGKWSCRICSSKDHNGLIHTDKDSQKKPQKDKTNLTKDNGQESKEQTQSTKSSITTEKGQVSAILRTIKAWAIAEDGSRQMVRIFFDSGSELNLMKRDIADKLGLDGQRTSLSMTLTGGEETQSKNEKIVNFRLGSLDGSYISPLIEATTIKKVTSDLRAVPVNPGNYPHLKDILLTETYPRQECQVHILIGEPWYSELTSGNIVKGQINEPSAIQTKLGWMLGGSFPDSNKKSHSYHSMRCGIKNVDLTDFWKLEHIGILPKDDEDFTLEEQEAMDLMKKNSVYCPQNKQWSTTLLFKEKIDKIDSNFGRAIAVAKKVESDSIKKGTQKELNDAYDCYLQEDFAEEVTDDSSESNLKYYLQTHPVCRPDNETTKVRIVMNAGAKDKQGRSLNSYLHTGPCLLPDFVGILLRFRNFQNVFATDVSKMFLRIKLHEHKDLLRWVWRFCDTQKNFRTFRMSSLTFGVVTSPFQANWVIQESARMFQKDFPKAFEVLTNDTYMDNATSGGHEKKEVIQKIEELQEVLSRIGMPTQKWVSNCADLLENIPEELRSKSDSQSIFGINWNSASDKLTLKFSSINEESTREDTKRTLLQQMAKIFDPLGLFGPVILVAKLLFQDLCQKKLQWDDSLPDDIQTKWSTWKNDVKNITNFEQDRCVNDTTKKIKAQGLIGFGDASEMGYGCCIYIKTIYTDDSVTTKLLLAKNRIVPIDKEKKGLTIVRLELLAMLLLANALDWTKKHLKIPVIAAFTDSQINLCRVRKGHTPFKVWVAGRIKEITELVNKNLWKFCPGTINPADINSRGCGADELKSSDLWWNGPEFITKDEIYWPKEDKENIILSEEEKELRKWLSTASLRSPKFENDDELEIPSVLVATSSLNPQILDKVVNRFEKWEKLIRLCAYILRFGYPTHKKFRNQELTVQEIRQVEIFLMRKAQQTGFEKEFDQLSKSQPLKPESKSPLRDLHPKFDNQKRLILLETRLVQSNLPEGTKRPIVLPKNNSIVKKYVLYLHRLYGHLGNNQTLEMVRRNYHIPQGRQQVRSILRGCVTPKCQKPKPLSQIMAPLPQERIDEPTSFKNVACDLFGPMVIKTCETDCPHNQSTKVYGCIFTCFHTRAIHLELLESASTEDFLIGFRNFVARRGCPEMMFSDNGRNFVKASKEIRSLFKSINWKKVTDENLHKGIQWVFNVETAAHMNGLCERLIQSVKKPLRIILGQKQLTFRELQSVLTEVEGLINARPLVMSSEDPNDWNPISPSELIIGRRMDTLGDPNFKAKGSSVDFKTMWRKRQLTLNAFWKTWTKSYLMTLQIRQKWRQPSNDDLMNKVVLIKDDNLNRNEWKLGRISELFKSRDGMVRAVALKTPKGTIRRPIQKLALLESVF